MSSFIHGTITNNDRLNNRDMQWHEQTKGPTQLKLVLNDQIENVKFMNLFNRIERLLSPFFWRNVYHNDQVFRKLFIPKIKSKINAPSTVNDTKTIMDLSLQAFLDDGSKKWSSEVNKDDMLETVYSQVKVMMFAGHETTAQSLLVPFFPFCWFPCYLFAFCFVSCSWRQRAISINIDFILRMGHYNTNRVKEAYF